LKIANEYLFGMSSSVSSSLRILKQGPFSSGRIGLREVMNPSLEAPEYFVTPEEAAAFLRCSPITVKRLAREGKLPAHAVTNGLRKRWRFLLSELAFAMRPEVSLKASSAPLKQGGSGK
jgi:excisionase family DNA binding protein